MPISWADPLSRVLHTFAMLPLSEGVMLGLWSRKSVEPAAAAQAGAGEVAFTVEDAAAVNNRRIADWKKRGLTDPPGTRANGFRPDLRGIRS